MFGAFFEPTIIRCYEIPITIIILGTHLTVRVQYHYALSAEFLQWLILDFCENGASSQVHM